MRHGEYDDAAHRSGRADDTGMNQQPPDIAAANPREGSIATLGWRAMLPARLAPLRDLAHDLRWTWSRRADALWARMDADVWDHTHNPWTLLEDLSAARLEALAGDADFVAHLADVTAERRAYLDAPTWFEETHGGTAVKGVAFFCMEFGLGQALPLYAGGLGVLAGDYLKAASDLGVPAIGVGLLYQEGYFRQMIDASGWQQEAYPYNEPATLPVRRALDAEGAPLHVDVDLPGRSLGLRVWLAHVGRSTLYLLDSNDPMNSAVDRGITGKLYGGGTEMRLLQELVLGVAGWRVVEATHPEIEICHLNEGHAAFAVLERARSLSARLGIGFEQALWASRAGNVFTTHTPVSAGFDHYPASLLQQYRSVVSAPLVESIRGALMSLAGASAESGFNMACLALRGAYASFGVSALHGAVSRHIFQEMFPRWPEQEVPVAHVTNGVHVPSWESPAAEAVFSGNGNDPWRRSPETVRATLAQADDATLWEMRARSRLHLVQSVRERLHKHLTVRGQAASVVALAENVLDPNVLTLGFARRFTAYKRPNLLLRDRTRLERLLGDPDRPLQLVVAGKAHPADETGKRMIAEWVAFTAHPHLWHRVVFLEDYDITLAQEMVQGVDVWINTPRRPWEACGTSGMKVLVNGGINLSELDGWWAEAYAADLGWAIGTTRQPDDAAQDARDAEELYSLLERVVLPEFYSREAGIPRAWIARVRQSIATLAPRFSATRMVQDYLTQAYLPAAAALRRRLADGAAVAHELRQWERRLHRGWRSLHIGAPEVTREADGWSWVLPVYLGEIGPDDIRVELYADAAGTAPAQAVALTRGAPVIGAVGGFSYTGRVASARPATDYTPRIVPFHPDVRVPGELPLIFWKD